MLKDNMQWQRAVCVTGAIFILLLGCPFLVMGGRDISCDFDDDDCGYTNTGSDTFGWTRIRKNSTSADQHMFAGTFLPTTILTSSVFSFSEQATACLQIRYRIHGDDSNTTIGVFSVDGDTSSSSNSDREEVFLYTGPGGDSSEWVKSSRETSSVEPFRLQIEVNGYSEVDLDDITVLPYGACSGGISCSFDTDWCGYSSSGPELSVSNSNLSVVTGPMSDHTAASSSFVAFRPDPFVNGSSATLRSPSETNFSTFPWCLEFWYHIFGTDVASLKVEDSSDSIVWSRFNSDNRNWHLAQVDMATNTAITFRFEAESGGNTIVAIDDIYADSKACQLRQAANCDFESDLCGYTVSGDSEDVERRVDELENVALGKPVYRSREWPSTEQMERIVDGEYGTHGPDHCVTSLDAPSASGKHWVRIDLLDSYKVEKVVIHTRGDCCGENFQDVSVFVSNTYIYEEVSSVDLCREFRSRASLGQVVTVLCIDGVKTGNHVWLQRQDSAPLSVCEVDVMARTAHYLRRREATPPENATALLESPVLTGQPSKLCLRLAYHLKEEGIGTLKVYTETMGGERTLVLEASNYTAGLALAEVDLDFTEPIKVVFEAVAYLDSTRSVTAANVALDSVSVDWNTCQPVNLTSNWTFSCDRPTTPCARGADCEDGVCQCLDDDDGLQCQIPAANRSCPGPVQPDCGSGQCYTQEDSEAGCYCDDGYYGQNCQHEMVHAECDDTTMVVNIYPYGYDVTKTASNQPLLPDAEDGECHFLTAEVFEMANPLYIQKNWDGYVRAFLHTDPNCGNVTIVEDSDTEKTYSRTFNVYYNYLGRDPTDTKVTVNCTVEKEMTTTTTTQATTTTEMQTTTTTPMPTTTPTTHRPTPPLPAPYVTGVVTHAGRRWLSRYPPVTEDTLQVDLSLNVPNFAKMTAIRVLRCMVSTGSRSTVFVSNGCAVPPIGQLVMTGPMARTQVMLIRMMRRDFRRRMRLSFVCTVRLCHARTDFSCFQMRSCFGRKKRAAEVQSDHAKGDNQVDVTFDFSE